MDNEKQQELENLELYKGLSERLFTFINNDNSSLMKDSDNNSMVILLDAAWGMGKTTFINTWEKKYRDEINIVKYNAWENDDYPNAFEPLFDRIIGELWDKGKKKEIIKLQINFNKLLISAGKTVVNYGLKKIDDELAEAVNNVIQEVTKDNIQDWFQSISYDKFNELVKNFKFSELVSFLNEEKIIEFQMQRYKDHNELGFFNKHNKRKENFQQALDQITKEKLVIIIDELDRCRPTFAIETLEFIKHYLKNEKITFLLSADPKHLASCIESLYGIKMDAYGYLNRFFDIKIRMPLNMYNRKNYIKDKLETYSLLSCCELSNIEEEIAYFDLSLRDINHAFRAMRVLFNSINEKYVIPMEENFEVILYLIILKIKYPEIYNLILFGKFDYNRGLQYQEEGYPKIKEYYLYKDESRIRKFIHSMGNGGNSREVKDEKSFTHIEIVDVYDNDTLSNMRVGEAIDFFLSFI